MLYALLIKSNDNYIRKGVYTTENECRDRIKFYEELYQKHKMVMEYKIEIIEVD